MACFMGVSSDGVRGQAGHSAGKAEMHGTAGRGAGRAAQIKTMGTDKRADERLVRFFLLIAIALEKKSPGYRVPGIFVGHHFAGFVSA